MTSTAKQIPPAAVRNTPPLLAILTRLLADREGTVLEIAAGSGYHAAAFAAALPHVTWQPSDPDDSARASITAYVEDAGLPNLRLPLALDAAADSWPPLEATAVVCINMIHISPWPATEGLFRGAARVLKAGGVLVTYGPYSIDGDFLAESNIAFDQSLRARNAAWGLRDVRDVAAEAAKRGFSHTETIRMPANNLTLVFRKA